MSLLWLGPRTALSLYFSASGLLSKPPHGGPGGESNPSRHACHSLPSSTSNHSAGLSACLITETCRRAELDGWGRRLLVNVRNRFMGKWMRFGGRGRPIVLCWPNSGGYSRRNRASPRCLQCTGAFFLSIAKQQRDTFSRGRLML